MTPIFDRLVAERGDPAEFAAHEPQTWEPWTYAVDRVFDLSSAPVSRAGRRQQPKARKKRR